MKLIMTSVVFLFVGVIIATPSSDTLRLNFSFIEYTTKAQKDIGIQILLEINYTNTCN